MKVQKALIVLWNFFIGFISLWWFVIAYAAAVNIEGSEDQVVLQPYGWLALITLAFIILYSNIKIYKKFFKKSSCVILWQLVPFLIGLFSALAITW